MSETVIDRDYTENRNSCNSPIPGCVIYAPETMRVSGRVLTTDQLLARLRERKIKNADIARTLGITPSRVTEIFNGDRRVLLDEAVKLAQAYGLEPEPKATPLPPQMIRLSVLYVAAVLGVPLERTEERMADILATLRAFSEFVADPKVRRSVESAEGFFQAMLLRPQAAPEAQSESDPERTH
jgi:transcriptional regulator with XRE-family HTH domain